MKKVVIAGSASLIDTMEYWRDYWDSKDGYRVINYPQAIDKDSFDKLYPDVHGNFFKDILSSDILFVANDDKNGISGYIGAETFAELAFAVVQKFVNHQNIDVILAKFPDKKVQCFEEIELWLRLGWIRLN